MPGQILNRHLQKQRTNLTHLFCGTPGWKFNERKGDNVRKKEKDRVANTSSQALLGYCRDTNCVQLQATYLSVIFFLHVLPLTTQNFDRKASHAFYTSAGPMWLAF
jgi:hypothetical protein